MYNSNTIKNGLRKFFNSSESTYHTEGDAYEQKQSEKNAGALIGAAFLMATSAIGPGF